MRAYRLFAFASMLAIASAAALAEPPHWRERDHRVNDSRSNDRRAVRDVVGEVEQNYRGHVVDVKPPRSNEDMYRVRVLQEGGRVKTLHVPANRERKAGRDR